MIDIRLSMIIDHDHEVADHFCLFWLAMDKTSVASSSAYAAASIRRRPSGRLKGPVCSAARDFGPQAAALWHLKPLEGRGS
eukprot:SAG22_NODE_2073_length_3049_cov_22.966102_2_plen_81_part_00